jgi:phage gp46-like protein
MNALHDFEGDSLLYETPDGGELAVENGLFVSDKQFSTAVYLSLFGGNKEDTGKTKNKNEWWGNVINGVTENEKLRSRFQYIITGLPMTVKNIKEAETAAAMDLQWFLDEKIADEIYTYGQTTGKNKFNLTVEIKKDKLTIFENVYSLLWGVGYGDSI